LGPCHAHTSFVPVHVHQLYPVFLQIFTLIISSKCMVHPCTTCIRDQPSPQGCPFHFQPEVKQGFSLGVLDCATTHIKYLETTQRQLLTSLQQAEIETSCLSCHRGRFKVCQTSSVTDARYADILRLGVRTVPVPHGLDGSRTRAVPTSFQLLGRMVDGTV